MEEENLLKILLVPAQLLEEGLLREPEYTSPFILSAALGFPTSETVNTVDKLDKKSHIALPDPKRDPPAPESGHTGRVSDVVSTSAGFSRPR